MTRGGMREYVEAVRGRYLRAGKGEKGRMLDEFCRTTGHHRKAAVAGPAVWAGGRARALPAVGGRGRHLLQTTGAVCA